MSAHAEIDIVATEREVWTVIADIASWPTWNPAVREAILDGELEVGSRFRYATVFGSMTCRLTDVDAPHSLAWGGRLLTMSQRQLWRIDQGSDRSHVRTEASMSGLGARLFKGRLSERLQAELDATVQLLKLEAEVRSTQSREGAGRTAAKSAGAGI